MSAPRGGRPPRGRPPARADREVVYGRNPVRELIRAARRPVHAVWALAQVAEEPWLAGCAVEVRERDALGRAAGSADHQGVVAFTDPYPFADPHDLLDAPGPLVLLDAVQDPRNLGAVARVAEGAGAAGLIVPRRGSPGVTAVACKASAGAVEHLPVAQADNLASLVHDAAGSGRWSAGAVAPGEPDAEDYRTVAWDDAVMLVLGAEGAGLRPRLRAVCDRLVTIPMRGHVASLNLSIAAAILVFEVARTRDSA